MVLLTAKHGPNAGGLFWGCNDYPRCKGIRAYPSTDGEADATLPPVAATTPIAPPGAAPACPECESEMVMKVARKGRNAGRGFWACTRYPECRGTRDADAGSDEASTNPLAGGLRKRVLWTDATTNRPGWTCRYTTAGASLRSVPESRAANGKTSLCWIARTKGTPNTAPDVVRLTGLLLKILQRGSVPPIDPRSEQLLLEMLGLGDQITAAPVPGDLSVRLQGHLDAKQLEEATLWQNPEFELEPSLVLGSAEEEQFVNEWVPTRLGPIAARWFIPQAPLDALVAGSGVPAAGQRQLDFLALGPNGETLAIEIDGSQHTGAELIDDDRDALLASAGVAVTRITVDELRAGMGPGLDEVSRFCAEQNGAVPDETYARLVWAPVQLHRLVLALIEALQAGFITGERWVIEVDDPLDVAVELLHPYLNLFLAADRLWAGHAVADEIVIGAPGRWRRYLAADEGFAPAELELEPDTADVLVRLEGDRASTDRLEPRVDGPEIVVRSARLPVDIKDPVYEGSGRITARSEGEHVEWALQVMLQSIFAKKDFYEGQLDALFEVIEGRDCAVLLPTGAGKSLIYQLAGLVLPGRTLVVDPLVALMEDQVEGLCAHGIDRVAAISSFTTAQGQSEALLEQVRSGYALFVFVSPERLQQRVFRDALRELSHTNLINLAVVDEAHCVSEWGHDFRTSYLNLGKTLRTVCGDAMETPPPILALTGTASRAVLRDVLIELGIERDSERSVVRPRSFDREELRFNIVRAEPANAQSALAGFLRGLPPRFGVPPGDFFSARGDETYSGIVFCPHANGEYGVVKVGDKLAEVTGSAPAMYAGTALKGFEKNDWERVKRAHAAAFKSNEVPLLISTKAFGMGIDKANIRYVVHFGIPGSIEGYYQEVGRAGRDRQRAECGLVLIEYDEDRARRLLADEFDIEDARSEPKPARSDNDDIDRQLYFHLGSFPGVEKELSAVADVLAQLGDLGQRRSIQLPMGTDGDAKSERERALHRLVVLGLVRDYMVEWGARMFPVELANVDSAGVVDNLVDYVRRNQPARAEAVRQRAAAAAIKPLQEAVIDCSRLLIEFVYDTVERSRRRALREMWLAARESIADPNGLFRQRILDYLSQGAIAPTLERLVDQPHFNYADWIDELGQIEADDAREMRGDAARLLSSYPDHPGLLLARSLSEVLDDRGNLQEFTSNLAASIESAAGRYNVSAEDRDAFANWLLNFCADKRDGAFALTLATLEQHGVALESVADWQRRSLREPGFDTAVRVLALASALERLNPQLTTIIDHYEGDRP